MVDVRFASTVDQAKQCLNAYNEWIRCEELKSHAKNPEKAARVCYQIRGDALTVCPTKWSGDWDGLKEEGLFYSYGGWKPETAGDHH